VPVVTAETVKLEDCPWSTVLGEAETVGATNAEFTVTTAAED
jgi:hypothetical protein